MSYGKDEKKFVECNVGGLHHGVVGEHELEHVRVEEAAAAVRDAHEFGRLAQRSLRKHSI